MEVRPNTPGYEARAESEDRGKQLQTGLQEVGADRVCLGVITAAFGVRGEVRIRSFTSLPENVAAYGPMLNENGDRRFKVESMRLCDGGVIAKLSGVDKREQARDISGTHLFVSRAALPSLEEDEWYHADIIGLSACGQDGDAWGRVSAVWDFGAGEILEIESPVHTDATGKRGGKEHKKSVLVPFTKENVAAVEACRGRIILADSAKRFC